MSPPRDFTKIIVGGEIPLLCTLFPYFTPTRRISFLRIISLGTSGVHSCNNQPNFTFQNSLEVTILLIGWKFPFFMYALLRQINTALSDGIFKPIRRFCPSVFSCNSLLPIISGTDDWLTDLVENKFSAGVHWKVNDQWNVYMTIISVT